VDTRIYLIHCTEAPSVEIKSTYTAGNKYL